MVRRKNKKTRILLPRLASLPLLVALGLAISWRLVVDYTECSDACGRQSHAGGCIPIVRWRLHDLHP